MTFKTTKLRDAITFALVAGATAVAGTGVAFAQDADEQQSTQATTLDRIEVTGSRIKRAEIEGAVPVVVIDRAELQASGDVSVADFLRDTTFNSFGSYQSTSGSSASGHSEISMRGLGGARTLVLIDGRRAPVSPLAGSGQDLNSIPMAAVERLEMLSDGASAIYGSDAIGGVINIILRKDYEGVEFTYGVGRPSNPGGDVEEMSVIVGSSGDRGRVLAGASYSSRDVIYTRDRDYWYSDDAPGASTYSNNFSFRTPFVTPDDTIGWTNPASLGNAGRLDHPVFGAAVPGLCTNGDDSDLFWMSGVVGQPIGANPPPPTCQFNHSATSANLTSLETTSVFARGDYQVNDDWMAYFSTSVTKSESFGRYAALPSSPWPGGAIVLPVGSPNHPSTITWTDADGNVRAGFNPDAADPYYQTATRTYTGLVDSDGNELPDITVNLADEDVLLYHRFAALGPRDNQTENTTYSFHGGFEGRVGIFDLDFGARYVESRAVNIGQNYVVGGLAQEQISNGNYNIYDPFAGNPSALGMTTTTTRDMFSKIKEFYASAAFDMFEMGGGTSAMVVGAEYREEQFQNQYDLLSASGQVAGSSGASSAGERDVTAVYAEMLFPIADSFEINLAARHDRYSDYGSDTSPKISMRWQPLDNLTLRGSYGQGFRAPTLQQISQEPAFSATATTDPATCIMLTGSECVSATQVTTYVISNPNLGSEKSDQWTLGVVWDATDWLNVSLDYYNIEITDSISTVSMATIVGCLRGTVVTCPSGISQFPAGTVIPDPPLGLGASFDGNNVNGGILNAQYGSVNLGSVETDGFDLNLRTNFDLGWGRLRNSMMVSYVNNYSTNGGQNAAGFYGYPEFRATLNNVLTVGDWDFNWNINHMDSQEDGFIPSWTINNVQVSYNAPWNATITLGVNNLADKAPADAFYAATTYDYYLYDPWGRVPYVRYTQRF